MGAFEWPGTTDEFVLVHPVTGLANRSNVLQIAGAASNTIVDIGYGFQKGTTNVPVCGGMVVDIRNSR